MLIKNGTLWQRSLKPIWVNNNGTWVRGSEWINVNGVWKQLIPNNAVVLYANSTIPADAILCNGSYGTPDLRNRTIKGSTTALTLGGTSQHNGTDHGSAATFSTASYGSPYVNNPLGFTTGTLSNLFTHTHYVYSHAHSGNASNESRTTQLVPTMGCPYLGQYAVLLSANSTGPAFTAALTCYLIKMAETYLALTGSDTHTHDISSAYTDTCTVSTPEKTNNLGTWYTSHDHLVDHKPIVAYNIPRLSSAYTYYVNTTTKYYLNDLPSGTLMLFTDSNIPRGWTYYDLPNHLSGPASDFANAGGGHAHQGSPSYWVSTYRAISGAIAGTAPGTVNTERYIPSHEHGAGSEVHPYSVTTAPLSVTFYIAKKD